MWQQLAATGKAPEPADWFFWAEKGDKVESEGETSFESTEADYEADRALVKQMMGTA